MFLHRILVPVDFSRASSPSLAYAIGLARATGAEVSLLHVLPAPSAVLVAFDAYAGRPLPEPSSDERLSASDQLASIIASVDHSGVVVHQEVAVGDPAATIVCVAVEEAQDLIVVGTHARSELSRFVTGSVTHTLLSTAPCPVLAISPA